MLYDYTDPKTGKKPISLALSKEDARILGLYGDRIGDIVCAVKAWPNIKRNFRLKRTVWLMDIVSTICYLMDLPVPKHAEGTCFRDNSLFTGTFKSIHPQIRSLGFCIGANFSRGFERI